MEKYVGILLTILIGLAYTILMVNKKQSKKASYEDKYVDKTDDLVVITRDLITKRALNNTKGDIVFYLLTIILLVLQFVIELKLLVIAILIILILILTSIINLINLKTKLLIASNKFTISEGTIINKYTKTVDNKVQFYVETDTGADFPFHVTEEMFELIEVGDLYYVIRINDDFQLYDRRKYKLSEDLKRLTQLDK